MRLLVFSAVLAFATAFSAQGQTTEIADVDFKNSISIKGHTLNLNGGGVREKLWIDLYVGALYLTNKSSNGAEIMKADKAMNIRLHIVSGLITSEKMTDAVEEGFEKSTDGNQEKFRTQINAFKKAFSEEIKEDDEYDIAWVPGTGVVIFKNGKEHSTIKAGVDFKAALFGIWLCDDPADEDLKEGMLGLD